MARVRKMRRIGRYGEPLGIGWGTARFTLYYPFSWLIKTRYEHIERIPQTGGAIFVVNHVSHVDPFLVSKFMLDAARSPVFLAKESIFSVPVVGWGMRAMGHVPVKRGTVDAAQSLSAAVAALHAGRVIILHPEGTVTRDPDGWPMSGRTGAARLAALVPDVAVIPLAQWGVQEQIDLYRKRVRLIPRPEHVISVGEPIDLSAWRDRPADTESLREMTELIMQQLRTDVARLRGVPAPAGPLHQWVRPHEGDAA